MKPCTHGMPTPKACVRCMEDGNWEVVRPATVEVVRTSPARRAGHCGGCDLPIIVGQSIDRLSDQTHVHEGCAA